MTLHDAAITRFGQWWKRSLRGGYAFAEGAYIHRAPPERHWIKESRRALIWGLIIPAISAIVTLSVGTWGVVGFTDLPGPNHPSCFARQSIYKEKLVARSIFSAW